MSGQHEFPDRICTHGGEVLESVHGLTEQPVGLVLVLVSSVGSVQSSVVDALLDRSSDERL